MIIVGSLKPHAIGEIVPLVLNMTGNGDMVHQPFVIIRESTYQEWYDSIEKLPEYDYSPTPGAYYYEVTTD